MSKFVSALTSKIFDYKDSPPLTLCSFLKYSNGMILLKFVVFLYLYNSKKGTMPFCRVSSFPSMKTWASF